MSEYTDLVEEFKILKHKIFADETFVVYQDSDDMKRYEQLLGFFYPCFRTNGWVSPL